MAWGATHPLQQFIQSIKHFILRIDKSNFRLQYIWCYSYQHDIKSHAHGIVFIKCQRKQERSTSNKVKSLPPVIFHTIPVALSIPISSKGDCMAFNAASLALVFPTQKQAPQKILVFYVHTWWEQTKNSNERSSIKRHPQANELPIAWQAKHHYKTNICLDMNNLLPSSSI